MREKAKKHVNKYHRVSIDQHWELVKKVKENPRTLFVIVADEAHVAPTKPNAKAGNEQGIIPYRYRDLTQLMTHTTHIRAYTEIH